MGFAVFKFPPAKANIKGVYLVYEHVCPGKANRHIYGKNFCKIDLSLAKSWTQMLKSSWTGSHDPTTLSHLFWLEFSET